VWVYARSLAINFDLLAVDILDVITLAVVLLASFAYKIKAPGPSSVLFYGLVALVGAYMLAIKLLILVDASVLSAPLVWILLAVSWVPLLQLPLDLILTKRSTHSSVDLAAPIAAVPGHHRSRRLAAPTHYAQGLALVPVDLATPPTTARNYLRVYTQQSEPRAADSSKFFTPTASRANPAVSLQDAPHVDGTEADEAAQAVSHEHTSVTTDLNTFAAAASAQEVQPLPAFGELTPTRTHASTASNLSPLLVSCRVLLVFDLDEMMDNSAEPSMYTEIYL
jgi:hypothetical protein